MATTTNNGWQIPNDTDLVKNGASAIRTLGNSIDTSIGTGLLAWTNWTPSTYGITLGNGTIIARYSVLGKRVEGYIQFTLGSTSAITGGIGFAMPITPRAPYLGVVVGRAQDSGTQTYTLAPQFIGGDIFTYAIGATSTYGYTIQTNATVPFTWTNTDVLYLAFNYEAG